MTGIEIWILMNKEYQLESQEVHLKVNTTISKVIMVTPKDLMIEDLEGRELTFQMKISVDTISLDPFLIPNTMLHMGNKD